MIELLRDRGDMAIVLVEQFFDFAYGLADRITVLTRGRVTMAGTKADTPRDDVLKALSFEGRAH